MGLTVEAAAAGIKGPLLSLPLKSKWLGTDETGIISNGSYSLSCEVRIPCLVRYLVPIWHSALAF